MPRHRVYGSDPGDVNEETRRAVFLITEGIDDHLIWDLRTTIIYGVDIRGERRHRTLEESLEAMRAMVNLTAHVNRVLQRLLDDLGPERCLSLLHKMDSEAN